MTTTYKGREAWTDTDRGGATLTGERLRGVACHYPAAGNVELADLSAEAVARRLQGWRAYHLSRGWSDIGYQVAIDGSGRVWDLRGIGRVPAAHASDSNPDANEEWGACLFVVGNLEQPTKAQVNAFCDWRNDRWLRKWPHATRITGHQRVPGAATSCPGQAVLDLIDSGRLKRDRDGGLNKVEIARDYFDAGLQLLDATDADRVVVHRVADRLRSNLEQLPDS